MLERDAPLIGEEGGVELAELPCASVKVGVPGRFSNGGRGFEAGENAFDVTRSQSSLILSDDIGRMKAGLNLQYGWSIRMRARCRPGAEVDAYLENLADVVSVRDYCHRSLCPTLLAVQFKCDLFYDSRRRDDEIHRSDCRVPGDETRALSFYESTECGCPFDAPVNRMMKLGNSRECRGKCVNLARHKSIEEIDGLILALVID